RFVRSETASEQRPWIGQVKPMRQKALMLIVWGMCCLAQLPVVGSTFAQARTTHGTPNDCDSAAAKAADISGVPVNVLMAISRVETGRTVGGVLSPWPWTVNQAGAGSFFQSAAEATAHVLRALADGHRNIDIGCFQINIRWHGAGFTSLEAMFEPTRNALYAARFLRQLHDEFGTWDGAIGAYHSRQSGAATSYLTKVSALMDNMQAPPTPEVDLTSTARDNRYPLLRPGKGGGYGSLVASALDRPAIPLFR
ncbi:MAG: hypothetical protein ACK4GC_15000, partial [Paracoccaceae bacterium]